MATSNLMMGPQ
jgi:hypothetical protein